MMYVARLHRCERGAASAEYMIVLCAVSLGAALAVVAAGALLLQLFHYQRQLLLLPIP